MSKIDLSVAIIFKNEIRCLERCMQSLQPLRERVSTELVMADTGSTDGSRAIAERHADILFDFPWINDFAAARNAVLERCSGKWMLTVDCDEWLDADIDELACFLQSDGANRLDLAGITQRNYTDPGWNLYGDAIVPRMVRLAAAPRYVGAIHEAPVFPTKPQEILLPRVILHHDGYVMLNEDSKAGRQKRKRNVTLLKKELERDPDNLQRLQQYIEAGWDEPNHLDCVRRAVELTRARWRGWREVGPPILRTAVDCAHKKHLPEEREWTSLALRMFPDSCFTQIDLMFTRILQANDDTNAAAVAALCEEFLAACRDAATDTERLADQTQFGVLNHFNPYVEQYIRIRLIEANRILGRFDQISPLTKTMKWQAFDAELTRDLLDQLEYPESGVDLSAVLALMWNGISEPKPTAERAEERMKAFRQQLAVEESASGELLRLAAKVKEVLGKLPEDDPIVLDLKDSNAYRKVAQLIEGGAV